MNWKRLIDSLNEGATQAAIAEKYGIAQSMISDLRLGKRNPNMASLRMMAEAEGLPAWRLVQLAERYGRRSDDHRATA